MFYLPKTILSVVLATSVIGSWAQSTAEHEQHHPKTPATEQSSSKRTDTMTKAGGVEKMAGMQIKMKEMHEKMMNAKSPDERKALMAEHMNTMKDGMAMMGTMGSSSTAGMQGKKSRAGNMAEHHQMMEMRMEMMESMMQMMMDQMPQPNAQ